MRCQRGGGGIGPSHAVGHGIARVEKDGGIGRVWSISIRDYNIVLVALAAAAAGKGALHPDS